MAIYDKEGREVRDRDVGQIVRFLTNTFNQATAKLDRPHRDPKTGANEAYFMQTEFAYLLNELILAPRCMQQKYIADCNDFIDQAVTYMVTRETENV